MTYLNQITIDGVTPYSGLQDAFGRVRISNPENVFNSKQIFNDADIADSAENYPQFFDNQETSGAGTATAFDVNAASTTLSVSNVTAGTRVRQTKRRFNYQPGKAQLIFLTGVFGTGGSGITKRYGLFDEQNGLFFEQDGTTFYVVKRSYVTGSPVDTTVAQASWNIDPMDGNGPSGKTLDITKSQIFVIDFEWLGVGGVRFGVVIDNILYYVHHFLHSNVLDGVYMSTPNLPVRCEISNDVSGAANSIEMICCAIISEGGTQQTGVSRSHSTDVTAITLGNTANTYPLVGVRLRSTHLGMTLDLRTISLLLTTSPDTVFWTIQVNPILSGAPTWSNLSMSGSQVATGNGTLTVTTAGEVIDSGYISATNQVRETSESQLTGLREKLGSLIDGTPDELWLCARPIDSSTNVLASIHWFEGL